MLRKKGSIDPSFEHPIFAERAAQAMVPQLPKAVRHPPHNSQDHTHEWQHQLYAAARHGSLRQQIGNQDLVGGMSEQCSVHDVYDYYTAMGSHEATAWAASASTWNSLLYDPRLIQHEGAVGQPSETANVREAPVSQNLPRTRLSNAALFLEEKDEDPSQAHHWEGSTCNESFLWLNGGAGNIRACSSNSSAFEGAEASEEKPFAGHDKVSQFLAANADEAAGPKAWSESPATERATAAENEVARLRAGFGELLTFANLQPRSLADAVREVVRVGWDNITWNRQYTALHLAAENGRADITKLLLSLRADPSVIDYKGRTAVDIAKHRRHAECVEVLANLQSEQSKEPDAIKAPLPAR